MKAIYRLLVGSALVTFSFVVSFIVLCLAGLSIASPWILLPILPLALILVFISAAIISKARVDYEMAPFSNTDFFLANSVIEYLQEIFIEPFQRMCCFRLNSYEEEMRDEWSLQEQMEDCEQSLADTDEYSDSYSEDNDSAYFKRGSICVHKMDLEEEMELSGFTCRM